MVLARLRRRGAPLAGLLITTLLSPMLFPIGIAIADEGKAPEGTAETPATSARPAEAPSESGEKPAAAQSTSPSSSTMSPNASPAATTSPIKGTTSQLSLPQGAGKLRGMGESFSAELSTGIATYQVPFVLPAARGAAQPSLGLSYSSSGGYGIAGAAWAMGVPAISRQLDRGIPKYNDPAPGGAWYPEQDRFVFGSDELVPICLVQGTSCSGASEAMPAWSAGWQYFRTRVEGAFVRLFWSPDHRTWRIQDKNGVSTELGAPLDGSNDIGGLEVDPSNAAHIFSWRAVRQYDAQGDANPAGTALPAPVNTIIYRYQVIDGSSYLSDVYDTSPAAVPTSTDVTTYAHHVHFSYEQRPDIATSYRRGWPFRTSQRLTTVDVTSFDFAGSSSARSLVRRYHLGYDGTSHASLLTSVQPEGRCDQPVFESNGLLPSSTGCPTLPAMTFAYQHVAPYAIDGTPSSPDLPGFEGFDDRVHSMTSSPPHSIDETLTDLFDLNADGLPDILLTDPATNNGSHTIYFNGAGGKGDTFAAGAPVAVQGVPNEDAYTLSFSNSNVTSLDVDGDGIANLLHMPQVNTYSVYNPVLGASGWVWQGRAVTTASQQSPKIDFTGKNADIRLMDVNADGLLDIVYSSPTEYQTFFSLGRYPGGDGQYGQATWTGSTTANISNDPVTSCTPSSTTAVRFSDTDVRVADMDGDGFPDIVRARPGSILYWPGRGNGTWGAGSASCPAGTLGAGRQVTMANSPQFGITDGSYLMMEDVNGDARADLIKVNFNEVDVYLNVDGTNWTARHIIANAPTNSTVSNRVRLTDINGSGTPDILWGVGNSYQYIDLAGGSRPWVLTSASNGLGRTTEFEYTTSTAQMLAAEAAGSPWQSKMPVVAHVVSRITDRDHLDAAGRTGGSYVTEYTYRDPVYEGRQREFRGFRDVRARKVGDANSPTSITESTFLLGECQDEPGATGMCDISQRWRDNPRESLKGLPVLTETFDESGTYLSTAHSTYRLRRLLVGLDGREVRHAFQVGMDTYRYDNGPFTPLVSSVTLNDVELERTPFNIESDLKRAVSLHSSAGRAHLFSSSDVDTSGNPVNTFDYGCVDGCTTSDEVISRSMRSALQPDDTSGWIWRTVETWVQGTNDPGTQRNHVLNQYDGKGLLQSVQADVKGTLPLDRFHAVSGKSIAPTLPTAVQDGLAQVVQYQYNAFGEVTAEIGNPGHCRNHQYDDAFQELVVQESIGTGYVTSGCGSSELTTMAEYDRGLGVLTKLTDPTGAVSTVSYDGVGRVTAVYKPDPDILGSPSSVPSMKLQYTLPVNATTTPYSVIHTFAQDGASATTQSFMESYAYVDGLGRTIAAASQADPTAGDQAPWIVQGLTDYDAKGAPSRAYLNSFFAGDPSALPSVPAAPSTRHRYDAFGRLVQSYTLDGSLALRNVYHAMSSDAWDEADIESGPHSGTPSSVQFNGHGFQVDSIERAHAGGQVEAYETQVTYLPTGEPLTISRVRSGSTPVVRWFRYDSFGHMVLNVEPNTTKNFTADPTADPSSFKAWRYAYDLSGQLVGNSDPRGCGTNYFYLADGRPLGEDYSPCRAEHLDYSVPDTSSGDGFEVYNLYDAADPDAANIPNFPSTAAALFNGKLASSSDRGAKTVLHYDGRGRIAGAARRTAKPGPASATLADRYAPHWYVRATTYDGADRTVVQSTGADLPELVGSDSASQLTTEYTKRGVVKDVGSSYRALVSSVTHDADGLPQQVTYGDVAQTATTFQYDGRRRLAAVLTQRAAPDSWTANPPVYTPAPDPSAGPSVFQKVLEDAAFDYDSVDNPTAIYDYRDPAEWPDSAKPVSRQFQYDDLYRLTRVDYSYAPGGDVWKSPFAAENAGDSTRAAPSPQVSFVNRMVSQSFRYDWLGNTIASDDDAHGFYDRSLGQITNGIANAGPYQLTGASQSTGGNHDGALTAAYDDAGDLQSLAVHRAGPCLPTGGLCGQRFAYEWDETGHLSRARRWDMADPGIASDPLPLGSPSAELKYAYDGDDGRALKTAVDASGKELHTVYISDSLELRRARWLGDDYERTSATEAVYLVAHDVHLGRLYYAGDDVPTLSSGHLHVLLELPDHLGSTSFVIDQATSELVEATAYQAYGATESDYRPDRWKAFREDYRFTGKEEDIEVGLTYFGARYLSPYLNRWVSPDPMSVHDLSADFNVYAYVHGRVLRAVDPFGLEDADKLDAGAPSGGAPLPAPGPIQTGTITQPNGTTVTTTGSGAPTPDNNSGASSSAAPQANNSAVGYTGPMGSNPGPGNGGLIGNALSYVAHAFAEWKQNWNKTLDAKAAESKQFATPVPQNNPALEVGKEVTGQIVEATPKVSETMLPFVPGAPAGATALRGTVKAAEQAAEEEVAETTAAKPLPAGNCFLGGTLVAICTGEQRPIETIREGDTVLTFDDTTGAIECRPVLRISARVSSDLTDVDVSTALGAEETIHTTLEHPFWVEHKGWTPARDLGPGEQLRATDGALLVVRDSVPAKGSSLVFNFEVQKDHSYFVGEARILVHNQCKTGGAPKGGGGTKPIYLPAWKKVNVDMPHILERHVPGGRLSAGRSVFPSTMDEASIRSAIRSAYESSAKVRVQGDRIVLQGQGAGLTIEMWFNKVTSTIETAFPPPVRQ